MIIEASYNSKQNRHCILAFSVLYFKTLDLIAAEYRIFLKKVLFPQNKSLLQAECKMFSPYFHILISINPQFYAWEHS